MSLLAGCATTPPQTLLTPRGQGRAVYETVSKEARRSGKWYFEVAIKASEIAAHVDASVFVGARSMRANAETFVPIRPVWQGLGIVLPPRDQLIGIALDLDGGQLYIRKDDVWMDGGPDQADGLPLTTGLDHQAVVTSSVALNVLLARQMIVINFGLQPFAYAPPVGYLPYHTGEVSASDSIQAPVSFVFR